WLCPDSRSPIHRSPERSSCTGRTTPPKNRPAPAALISILPAQNSHPSLPRSPALPFVFFLPKTPDSAGIYILSPEIRCKQVWKSRKGAHSRAPSQATAPSSCVRADRAHSALAHVL